VKRSNYGPSGCISPDPPVTLPEVLALPALGESWRIAYLPTNTRRIGIMTERPEWLTLYGAVADPEACRAVLIQWLKCRTREELVPWLSRLAGEKGFLYNEVLVRGQKTRWASCSSKGTISLSYKLLFLDRDAVRCILLHELCHTIVMNHSHRFWALLRGLEPNCRVIRKRMRDGWKHLPVWLESRTVRRPSEKVPVSQEGESDDCQTRDCR
jgi:predicted metal-dependent hydrolase